MNLLQLELCAASVEALPLAKTYGFTRIELCQNLEQGGLTPSAGLILQALELGIETHDFNATLTVTTHLRKNGHSKINMRGKA